MVFLRLKQLDHICTVKEESERLKRNVWERTKVSVRTTRRWARVTGTEVVKRRESRGDFCT